MLHCGSKVKHSKARGLGSDLAVPHLANEVQHWNIAGESCFTEPFNCNSAVHGCAAALINSTFDGLNMKEEVHDCTLAVWHWKLEVERCKAEVLTSKVGV